MSNLYDQLMKKAVNYEINDEVLEKTAQYLSRLDKKSQEICLALIFEYHTRIDGDVKLQERTLPYKGKTILKNMGAKFTLSVFSKDLIKLLMAFIEAGTKERLFDVQKEG